MTKEEAIDAIIQIYKDYNPTRRRSVLERPMEMNLFYLERIFRIIDNLIYDFSDSEIENFMKGDRK